MIMDEENISAVRPGAGGRLGKSSRLRHRTLVNTLFACGRSYYVAPLRLVWRGVGADGFDSLFCGFTPAGVGRVQVMVAVPKKKRRHAVDRVLMRRRIREAFRLGQQPLREVMERRADLRSLSLAFIYNESCNMPYSDVEHAVGKLIGKVCRKLDVECNQEHC